MWSYKGETDEIRLVWLLGYVSHLAADAIIHPIVQAIVGDYGHHKEEHRLCEMTQDPLIFDLEKNTEMNYAEFSSILKFCTESEHFDDLMYFWKRQLLAAYGEKGEEPHPELWFSNYTTAIDAAEGRSDVVDLFRHLGVGSNYIYRPKDEIVRDYPQYEEKYYKKVKLPTGDVGYFPADGFQRAVNNVLAAWIYAESFESIDRFPFF